MVDQRRSRSFSLTDRLSLRDELAGDIKTLYPSEGAVALNLRLGSTGCPVQALLERGLLLLAPVKDGKKENRKKDQGIHATRFPSGTVPSCLGPTQQPIFRGDHRLETSGGVTMSRLFLLVVVCLSTFALASSVEVVYVAQGTSILTYDVDPQTLTFTQVGSLAISGAATFGGLVPSPNDHFVYVMAADSAQTMHLYVYATDANGALQSPPTQTLDSKNLQSAQVDPSASFLYAIYGTPTSTGNQTTYSIHRYVVDPSTGAISQSTVEGKYTLNTFAGYTCNVTITGFNAAATELYDVVYCETHEGPYANYYERTVDATTGALGPGPDLFLGQRWQWKRRIRTVRGRPYIRLRLPR